LVVFDFDGTLASSTWAGLCRAYQKVIEKVCKKDPRIFFRNTREFRLWHSHDWEYNHQRTGLLPEREEEAKKIFYEVYDKKCVQIFPWVADLISRLGNQYRFAILTNRFGRKVAQLLGDLARKFAVIIGEEDMGRRLKPDPEGLWMILEKLRVDPENAIMIGDVKNDILTGQNANAKTGFVVWGFGELKDVKPLKPTFIFRKPEELYLKLAVG
jgi:HAD superfamily hydrolase (TIGR01549 family)